MKSVSHLTHGESRGHIMKRLRILVKGAVQGVGFRPFVYRLASDLGLCGWVINSPSGVKIEVEGTPSQLEEFIQCLRSKKPPMAVIQSLEYSVLQPVGFKSFEIRKSSGDEALEALVLPDISVCGECLDEIKDPSERRYHYPFTNCTNCGPRYTIIESIPYDRPNTTMKIFEMCEDCRGEYEDPRDRRFHAQPIGCPKCGPKMFLTGPEGEVLAEREGALSLTADKIRSGLVVAVKGLGGFLLLCDARNFSAVERLRKRKYREEKPFALMYPDLKSVKNDCVVIPKEEELLSSPQHPIVLLRKRESNAVAENVAPLNPYLGVMLPYTPLHHLLMEELNFPVVATSGNKTDEPIAKDNDEALQKLGPIADFFLMHDRPISRRVDDSVVRMVLGEEVVIRRARGYAPFPVEWKSNGKAILALGGQLKNTIAFSKGDNIFVSQHIGDLETYEAIESFREALQSLKNLYKFEPEIVAVDMHPRYLSAQFGDDLGKPLIRVQHHHAHVAGCMCENRVQGNVLGVAWDGVGYGSDGTPWGSEFLIASYGEFTRFAHFAPFPLPGGETAIRKPSHSALGLLYATFGEDIFDEEMMKLPCLSAFSEEELSLLVNCIKIKFNAPMVFGAGRLFDAVASILGLRHRCSFEAQAAMELEFHAMGAMDNKSSDKEHYPSELKSGEPIAVDWRPLVREMISDFLGGVNTHTIAFKYHSTLAKIILELAEISGNRRVVLTGGVFQNALLTELACNLLREKKFEVYTHHVVPPNDGGISVGQVAVASSMAG